MGEIGTSQRRCLPFPTAIALKKLAALLRATADKKSFNNSASRRDVKN